MRNRRQETNVPIVSVLCAVVVNLALRSNAHGRIEVRRVLTPEKGLRSRDAEADHFGCLKKDRDRSLCIGLVLIHDPPMMFFYEAFRRRYIG